MSGPRARFRNVVLVGIFHEIQRADWPSTTAQACQREQFRSMLDRVIEVHNISAVDDEAGSKKSVVEGVSKPGVTYFNMEIPLEKRGQDCSGGYADRELWQFRTSFNRAQWRTNVQCCHSVREDYLVEMCLGHTEEGARLLLVCGVEHVFRLAARFERIAETVSVESLFDQAWFDRAAWGVTKSVVRLAEWQRRTIAVRQRTPK